MWRFIEYMRSKPKAVRSQVAFFGSLVITSLIGAVWFFAQPATAPSVTAVEDTEVRESVSLFLEQAQNQFGQVVSSFKAFTTTPEAASTAPEPVVPPVPPAAVVMPDLRQVVESATSTTSAPAPVGRPIIIATTSAATASSSQ